MATRAVLETAEKRWEHVEHDADIGLRAVSSSLEGLFEAAAEALTALVTDPRSIQLRQAVSIRCQSPDHSLLLVDLERTEE